MGPNSIPYDECSSSGIRKGLYKMKKDITAITITYDYSGKGATILFTRKNIAHHYKYNSDTAMKIHLLTSNNKAEYYTHPTNKIIIHC